MKNNILIVDEAGFACICSALLEKEGHRTDIHTLSNAANVPAALEGYDLLITSFPYGGTVLQGLRRQDIAVIVLSDCIDHELFAVLEGFANCFCMIKPLDFDRFRFLVNQLVAGQPDGNGGYRIV